MFVDARYKVFYYAIAVGLVGSLIYLTYYYNPPYAFWDENYHIASAQKYIEGIMFMEPHPPLGKLFIALSEWMFHPNTQVDISHFVHTDYIKDFPKGYSFVGVRFFPSLFGMLSGVLFFFILYAISKRETLSFVFSSLYLFENAFVLHSRAAMLESIQVFFIFLVILYFLVLLERPKKGWKSFFFLGLLMGLAITVKINSLIVILLYPFLYFYQWDTQAGIVFHVKKFISDALAVTTGIVLVWIGVFYIHFSLTPKIGDNSYKASAEYMQILREHRTLGPSDYIIMMRDNLKYMAEYAKGVARYDACKKGENGSLASTWPVGNKSINYGWNKKNGKVSYRYLQGNPVIWLSVLFGILLAVSLLIGYAVYELKIKDRKLFYLIATFTTMYVSYMIVMINISRVMYLYHYFIALFFGMFILFLLYNYIFKEELEKNDLVLKIATCLYILSIIYTFYIFAPFTYAQPLNVLEFMERDWFEFWKLEPIL